MRNSVTVMQTIVIAVFGVLAGCATGSSGGQSSLYSRLPTGVTLLDTDTGRCTGSVQVREEQDGRTHDQELLLKPGENATFAVDVAKGDELAMELHRRHALGQRGGRLSRHDLACADLAPGRRCGPRARVLRATRQPLRPNGHSHMRRPIRAP